MAGEPGQGNRGGSDQEWLQGSFRDARGRAGTGRRGRGQAPGGSEPREHLPAGWGAAPADPADARSRAQGVGTLLGTDAAREMGFAF